MSAKVKHWQDPVNLVLGLWMIVSPWVLAYQAEPRPMWNSVIVGILIAAAAVYALPHGSLGSAACSRRR